MRFTLSGVQAGRAREFRLLLERMNRCRQLEDEIRADDIQIQRIANETGLTLPVLVNLSPMSGHFIDEVSKVQTLAGGYPYRQNN